MWSIQSLWTAAHYNLPITYIIIANGSYKMLKVLKHLVMGDKAEGRYAGYDFNEPGINFCQLARGMGLIGQRVEQPGELGDALKSAFESGKPNLVEVLVSGDFQTELGYLR